MRTRFLLCSMLGLLGCNSTPQSSAESAPQAAEPAPLEPAAKAPEKATPRIDDTTFHLALESEPNYSAGQPASVRLVLEARGGYHVNQDYPLRVELKAPPAVKLTKASLAKAVAAQFSEEAARFDLGFSAEPGSHELTAMVDFAVCTKETCVPDQRTLAVDLRVQ
jgi:hypothetical protein